MKNVSEVISVRRKRPRHEEQDLGRATSGEYMKACGEQPLSGKWTQIEHYILLAILHYLCDEKRHRITDPLDVVTNVYETVVDVVTNNDIRVSLYSTQVKSTNKGKNAAIP
jgi:hypothetical protein